jgi:hypothetical protein
MALAPDGRIFVCEQGGSLQVIQDGTLLASNYNGGALHFGKDGKLYVSVGDNTRWQGAAAREGRLHSHGQPFLLERRTLTLQAGRAYSLQMEFFENSRSSPRSSSGQRLPSGFPGGRTSPPLLRARDCGTKHLSLRSEVPPCPART